jgi:hypothetical protein
MHSLSDAKWDVRTTDQLHMEEFIYRKIASVFKNLIDKVTMSREDRELQAHERRMKESMARKDLYQDVSDAFENRTSLVLSKYSQFYVLSDKDEAIQKFFSAPILAK